MARYIDRYYTAKDLLRAVQHRYDAAGVHGGIWLKQYQNELFLLTSCLAYPSSFCLAKANEDDTHAAGPVRLQDGSTDTKLCATAVR